MKLVVYGPHRRLGVVHDDRVIDVSGAFAKYAYEVMDDGLPYEVAAASVPDELGKFIEAGERAIENSHRAIEYLTRRADDHRGVRGETLVELESNVKLHAPYGKRISHSLISPT